MWKVCNERKKVSVTVAVTKAGRGEIYTYLTIHLISSPTARMSREDRYNRTVSVADEVACSRKVAATNVLLPLSFPYCSM